MYAELLQKQQALTLIGPDPHLSALGRSSSNISSSAAVQEDCIGQELYAHALVAAREQLLAVLCSLSTTLQEELQELKGLAVGLEARRVRHHRGVQFTELQVSCSYNSVLMQQ
jgi:hypothetical protein